MNTTIIITLIIYKCVLLGIGFWAQRRTHDTEDFFLGGRQLGPVVAAISYSASSSSAWTLLGMSGMAYIVGVSSIWMATGAVIGCAVAWLWIAPRMMRNTREHNQLTLTEFLTQDSSEKDSKAIRIAASSIILVAFMVYISSQFQGAGNTFSTIFAMHPAESILLGGAIIIIYTLLGGFWAVSLTDTIQGLLMLAAAILLPTMAWMSAGGWEGISTALHNAGLTSQLSFTAHNTGLAAVGFVVGGLAVGISTAGQPHLVSRFMALRDQRALNQARWIAIGWFALVFYGMCALGLAARALLPQLDNPETLFFAMSTNVLPPVIGGVMIAAVLSAIMSTADSMLLVGAASVSHDLQVERRFPGKELLISRIAMVSLSLAAIALALCLPASIFDRALFAWVAVGSAFGPILFVRLAGVKVSGQGILRAMLSSFIAAAVLSFLPNTPGDIAERTLPFILGVTLLLLHRQKTPAVATAKV